MPTRPSGAKKPFGAASGIAEWKPRKIRVGGHSQIGLDGIDPYEFEHELQRSLRGHRTVGEGFNARLSEMYRVWRLVWTAQARMAVMARYMRWKERRG
jgi:hypothetical protein